MASPEDTADSASVPPTITRRTSWIIALLKRAGRFALAYIALEIATALAYIVLWGPRWQYASWREIYGAGIFVVILGFPIVWLPVRFGLFSLTLYTAVKARFRPFIACVLAGTVVGLLSAAKLDFGLAVLGEPLNPRDYDPLFWALFIREAPKFFGIGGLSGAFGGIVFWACLRSTRSRREIST